MSHTDDVIHHWGPPAAQARGCRFSECRGRGRAGEAAKLEWNDWDNDQSVGFRDGGKWMLGGYEFDIWPAGCGMRRLESRWAKRCAVK